MVSIAMSDRPISFEGGGQLLLHLCAGGRGADDPCRHCRLAAHDRSPPAILATAGAGIAFMSFGLLAFCHPAEMSAADFIAHLMAALVLGGGTVLAGSRLIRG
jgi:hypothetical protein